MGIGLEDHRPEDASRRFLKIQVRLISAHVPFVGTLIYLSPGFPLRGAEIWQAGTANVAGTALYEPAGLVTTKARKLYV